MIACPDASPQDRGRPVKQIVEKVNKLKDSVVPEKMLAVRRLLSGDVLITIDTAEIKKQLERSNDWLTMIDQIMKVNCHKFTILMHEMRTFALDYSKQKNMIRELLEQN